MHKDLLVSQTGLERIRSIRVRKRRGIQLTLNVDSPFTRA